MKALKYDKNFIEIVRRGRKEIFFRLIRGSDRKFFLRGLKQLSNESLKSRFFSLKKELTEKELDYITDLDFVHHFAMVVGAKYKVAGVLFEEGVGEARYIRNEKKPEEAELAITIIDKYQRQGIGNILFQHICCAALERGIVYFTGIIRQDNQGIISLLKTRIFSYFYSVIP